MAGDDSVAHGLPVNPKLNRIRFDDAADDLETEYAVNRRRSADELERRIRLHLLPFFGGRRLAAITTERYNIVSECDLVDAAQKLNTLQPVPPASDHDGLAATKPRSGEVGHNSGTAEPDRGPRLTVGL